MKRSHGIIMSVVLAAVAARLNAQPTSPPRLPQVPPPDSAPLPLPAPKPLPGSTRTQPPIGRFALIKDQRLIEGEVFLSQETITVRRGAIDTVVPKIDVLFIGSSREEVYEYQRKFVGPMDVEGRLKLAKWCAYSGMREHALAEARAVVSLEPTNAAAGQMVRLLEESLRKFPPPGAKAAPATIPPSSVRPVPLEPPLAGAAPVPVVSVPTTTIVVPPTKPLTPAATTDSVLPASVVQVFRSKVQPVLTNQCVTCHSRPDMVGFKLARLNDWDTNPAIINQNLKAVLAHVRNENPQTSPFLVIGLARHGGMREPAFVSDKAPAYRVLAEWVQMASPFVPPAKNSAIAPTPAQGPVSLLPLLPRVAEVSKPAAAALPLPPVSTPPGASMSIPVPQKLPPVPPPPELSGASSKPSAVEPPVADASAKKPIVIPIISVSFASDKKVETPKGPNPNNPGAPVDEFDPSMFNRAAHPPK